jgi:hypothetical protein
VARQGFVLIAIGPGAGVTLAVMSGRLMSGLLFGMNAYDPASYVMVVGALCASRHVP